MTDDPDPNYRHPKCYANLHGGCSTKISGEHYISHSLIKLYTFDDPTVKVKHDNGFGIRQSVSPKNFVVNALCRNHNTALDVTDKAAFEFAKFVRSIAIRFLGGAGEWGGPEQITISGDDLERWALKLLLNHAAGKAFSANQGLNLRADASSARMRDIEAIDADLRLVSRAWRVARHMSGCTPSTVHIDELLDARLDHGTLSPSCLRPRRRETARPRVRSCG